MPGCRSNPRLTQLQAFKGIQLQLHSLERNPKFRTSPGRPRIAPELEALIVRFARENSGWGYDRIVGALANLGHAVSDQTVGNILRRARSQAEPEYHQEGFHCLPHGRLGRY